MKPFGTPTDDRQCEWSSEGRNPILFLFSRPWYINDLDANPRFLQFLAKFDLQTRVGNQMMPFAKCRHRIASDFPGFGAVGQNDHMIGARDHRVLHVRIERVSPS